MLTVWCFDTSNCEELDFNNTIKLLPFELVEEILKYRFQKDRISRLTAMLLIRKALIHTGFTPQLLNNWKRDSFNKPFIRDWMYFNISHSENYVVLSFSQESELGIDIEVIKDDIDVDSLSLYFCQNERDIILTSENRKRQFYDIWTRNEAMLKGIGKGIVDGLNEFDCSVNRIKVAMEHWYLKEINISENCICYTASKIDEKNIPIEKIINLI